MCLRIRQEQAEHKVSGTTLTPPSLERLRPRLAGAVAVALVAGLAAAALVAPPSAQQTPPTPQQNAAPTLQSTETTAPTTSGAQEQAGVTPVVIEQTISGDDGVPTTTGAAKSVAGGCSHEL